MASTRNKNSEGDYQAQQKSLQLQFDNMTYTNQGNGTAFSTHFAGDGLLMGRMGSIPLSNNFVDVESHLHGTGSTNLVTPMKPVVPDIKQLQSLAVMNKLPTHIPEPLYMEPNQRPLRN